MSTTIAQPATTPIPVHLSANEFTAFILPLDAQARAYVYTGLASRL
jgi:hypothetical protein